MTTNPTAPRQVKLTQCSILSPMLEHRAVTPAQAEKFRTSGIDIRDAVVSVNIYESIFDNTISATIDIEESSAYPELFPLVGQEFVRLVFSVDYLGEVREFGRTFRIRRLGDQSFPADAKRTYTLDLVTPEFFTSLSSRMMKKYSQTTCTEAVRDIMSNRLHIPADRIKEIEETDLKISAVIPNYTPLQAINFFTSLGLTQEKLESNFLFYETLDGFWFVSVASLINPAKVEKRLKASGTWKTGDPTDVVATYEVNANKMTGQAKISEKDAYTSIIGLHQKQSFDVLVDITTGVLRSKMWHLDFFARTWEEDDSRYTDTFKKTTHLDEFPLYPDNFDQSVDRNVKLFIVPTNTSSAGSKYALSLGEQADENRLYQSVVLRNRQLRELRHLTTLLKVPGQPGVRAGSVIDLIYPTSRDLQGSDNAHASTPSGKTPYYSGRHLVTSVRHVLTQSSPSTMEYTMHLEATRDSFGTKLVPYDEDTRDT